MPNSQLKFSSSTTSPALAILIVAHNQATYLAETLASLRAQTVGMAALEFILIDDASTDATGALLETFAREMPNAKVKRVDFRNVGKTRNAALVEVTAPYLLFVDGDDVLTPDACEVLLYTAKNQQSDMVITPLQRFYDEFKCRAVDYKKAKTITLIPSALWMALLEHQKYMGHAAGTLFSLRLFREVRFVEIVCYEDVATMPALLEQQPKITKLDYPIYGYRQYGESTSSQLGDENAQSMLTMLTQLRSRVQDSQQALLFDALCVRQCRVLMDNVSSLSADSRDRIQALIEAIPKWPFLLSAKIRVRHKRLLLQNRRDVQRWRRGV